MTGQFATLLNPPLADIPPPPPEIPLLEATVPHPIVIIVAGLSVCLAMIVMAIRWRHQMERSLPAISAAVLIAVTTCVSAAWSGAQWKQHQRARDNWVPNGPVRERPILNESILEEPRDESVLDSSPLDESISDQPHPLERRIPPS